MGLVDKDDWRAAKRSFVVGFATCLGTLAAHFLVGMLTKNGSGDPTHTAD